MFLCISHRPPVIRTRQAQLAYRCRKVFHTCFPPKRGGATRELHDKFVIAYCDPLQCDRRVHATRTHILGGGEAEEAEGGDADEHSTLELTLLGIVCLAVFIFYALLLGQQWRQQRQQFNRHGHKSWHPTAGGSGWAMRAVRRALRVLDRKQA